MILDNNGNVYNPTIIHGSVDKIIIPRDRIKSGIEYIEITDDNFTANVGDEGYYVIADVNNTGSHLCRFNSKKDEEIILKQNLMPIVGIKKSDYTALIIAVGMKNCFYVRVKVKNGVYALALRFVLDKNEPYEDISFEIHKFSEEADYNTMAREYRNYQLGRGVCIPIKERFKENPNLKYASESVEIRIRLGWKPAPPTVLEQTAENEPEMQVACTFDRVIDIINELKRQGVDKAQICLVGWNKSGHDGQWPQAFPVEEKLGGEEKLKELIAHAQDNGYQIVCHTNSTDWYNIAKEKFPKDMVIKKADGSFSVNDLSWSGGRMYNLCPIKAYEIAQNELPKVSKLGFRGIHYIDVLSVIPLRRCYDKIHPATEKDCEEMFYKIGKLSHELFGGFASEGAFDFAAPYLDYALYTAFEGKSIDMLDEEIPLWQIVYHGIILSNPSTETINYTIKEKSVKKKFIAYGGRPSFYYYSHFLQGSNQDDWLGSQDIICDTDEQLKHSVLKIKEAYDDFKKSRFLQLEFIENYTVLENGEINITYSNGFVQKV